MTNEAIGTVANFLCCAIDKACIKNDFTKQSIRLILIIYS